MEINQESIYGCGAADWEKPEWGRFTQDGNILYAHVLEKGIGQYYLKKLKGKIKRATLLEDGSEVFVSGFWMGSNKPFVEGDDSFMNFGKPVQHTFPLPNEMDTVVRIQLRDSS